MSPSQVGISYQILQRVFNAYFFLIDIKNSFRFAVKAEDPKITPTPKYTRLN